MTALSALALTIAMLQPMPVLKGKYLTGREAVLPAHASGKVALLAFGFTYESRHAVEDWSNRFRHEYGAEPKVTFYEIPVISGAAQLGKWFIDSGMRKGTPKELHENVITIYGGAAPWKKLLDYKNPDDAYLLLLDPAGHVRWQYGGRFDEARWQELAKLTSSLLH